MGRESASYTTYGFEDLVATITHKAMGKLDLQGSGAVSITFGMANDVSTHDLAADGSVMTSKIRAGNGTVTIVVQQTSPADEWFTKLYNYLEEADLDEWAQISLMATAKHMKKTHECDNMAFQKKPDKVYQAQGQQVTWTFLAGDIREH